MAESFDMKLLQPEGSVAFTGAGNAGPLGGGWRGVYKWCLQAAERGGGSVRDDPLFALYDILILHLDADVAGEDPANYPVNPIARLAGVLPCEQPCPPPNDTTDRASTDPALVDRRSANAATNRSLHAVEMHRGMGRRHLLSARWADDKKGMGMPSGSGEPAGATAQSSSVRQDASRLSGEEAAIQEGWPRIAKRLTEAKRFQDEFRAVLKALPT